MSETTLSPRTVRLGPSRTRLIQAAVDEFAAYGLAGARVDRIAEKSGVNKRMIYVHFGSKESLFDEVVVSQINEMINATPFDADDLPDWGVAIFDFFRSNPHVFRILAWRNLERDSAPETEVASYERKVRLVARAQASGLVDSSLPAADLVAHVLGVVTSWAIASPALRADHSAAKATSDGRREGVRVAVSRLVSPHFGPPS